MKKFEQNTTDIVKDLKKLSIPAFVYPFVIKGYKYFGDNNRKLSILFHIFEVVVFRYTLINSRAEIESRLSEILINFTGDLADLREKIKNKFNEQYYWGDDRVLEYLSGAMCGNSVLNYLLWKYENSIQNAGYLVGDTTIVDEAIEHISPVTPTNGAPLASGYDVNDRNEYDEEFKNKYLNCIGNLMLISKSHNSSIGNKPFVVKLDSYNNNPLLNQQAEIKKFTDDTSPAKGWKRSAIEKRHKAIVDDFAVRRWSFDNINGN